MEATVQGVLIAAYFLAPGLVHYYVTRAFGLGSDSDPRDTELLLQSLTATLVLIAVEAAGLAALASAWDELRKQLQLLVSGGLASYAEQRPFLLYASGSVALGFNLLIAGVFGFFNLPGRIVERQLQKGGLSERPVWYTVLSGSGRGATTDPNLKRAVRVRMKSGLIYVGTVAAYKVRRDRTGSQDLALWDVLVAPDERTQPTPLLTKNPTRTAVIINSDEIAAIEVAYVEGSS